MKLIQKMEQIAKGYNVEIEHDDNANLYMTTLSISNRTPVHLYIRDSVQWYLFNNAKGTFAVTCSLFRYWRSEDENEILDLFRLSCDLMGRVR